MHTAPSVTIRQFALTIFFPIALCYFLSYVFRNINAVLAPDLTARGRMGARVMIEKFAVSTGHSERISRSESAIGRTSESGH